LTPLLVAIGPNSATRSSRAGLGTVNAGAIGQRRIVFSLSVAGPASHRWRLSAKVLTPEEARRIAVNIARPPGS
jgi:hypothetical protein